MRNPLQCPASGENFYAVATAERPGPDGRVKCFHCNKRVKLRGPGRSKFYVPTHHKE